MKVKAEKQNFMATHKATYSLRSGLRTDQVPPGLVIICLLPVARPGDQNGIVFQAPQPAGLEQMGRGVTEVGGYGHLAEALHLLGLHQFTQRLEGSAEKINATKKQGRILIFTIVNVMQHLQELRMNSKYTETLGIKQEKSR